MTYSLAVDIGGTFTDIILVNYERGTFHTEKTLSTPSHPLEGLKRGVQAILAKHGVRAEMVDGLVVHATTVVTNTVIERKGAEVALVATNGFTDTLQTRDEHRYDMYDLQIVFPEPLVPRARSFGIGERTLASGQVLEQPEPEEIATLVDTLAKLDVKSVAICFLHSYRNPSNEQAVASALHEALPDVMLSLSSEVSPQIREYPRFSTTVLNAYTQPIVAPYLTALQAWLREEGFPGRPLIMLSNGGVTAPATAARFPVRMIESGPAAGVLAATWYARQLGLSRLLSFDMGGTTAKACVVEEGEPLVAPQFEAGRIYRFKSGSGFPITIPSVDLIEIGAGGGSIAHCDRLGLLKVGPESAGADPGPACYDLGGEQPTVTDADLLLGYLDADFFLGGGMRLSRARAEEAMACLAQELALSPLETAWGVYQVVNEGMAAAARIHAVERGVDYRGVPLLAFGGAGPAHACHVAELLDSDTVIFPLRASVLSAYGTLVTPARLDLVRSAVSELAQIDWDATRWLFDELASEGRTVLEQAGTPSTEIQFLPQADMRYIGQQYEVTVPLPDGELNAGRLAEIREAFERQYEKLYGLRISDVPVEVVNWRLAALGPIPELPVPPQHHKPQVHTPTNALKGDRLAFFGDLLTVPVYDRATIQPGAAFDGPALIEEAETTVVIRPGWHVTVDELGNLIARR